MLQSILDFYFPCISDDLSQGPPVLVIGLSKRFNTETAVNNLTFRVSAGECFGLLGGNGAGKTTVFEIMTGNMAMTSGQVYISGHNIISSLPAARRSIGEQCYYSEHKTNTFTADIVFNHPSDRNNKEITFLIFNYMSLR